MSTYRVHVDYGTVMSLDNYDDGQQDVKKTMEVLAPVDHNQVAYESFRKCFYTPHEDIQKMAVHEVDELRRELAVRTEGADVPQPIRSFVHLGFDRKMLALLMKLGLEAPTAIQAQAFPVALSGRDMIGIAKTGSGKTLAFTLPMVRHVMDQRELRKDEGPIAIVLSPTRELTHQIFVQAKKFLNVYGAECAAIYGGVGKWEQIQAVRKGVEVVVATPGRLIEMIRKKTVKMNRVTFVVLDEADRMFEMGFEPQLRSIMGQIRPDRQTLMFSATFRRRIEALALDILDKPVKVMIGQIGQANEDIHQIAVVLPNDNAKWPWLMHNLKRIANEGRVLIFAGSKMGCETLTKNLNAMKFPSWCLHGDKSQQERSEALAKFKTGECQILVATDVASRGLDVKDVKTVVNFDVAKNIDIHVHRIGRTGRMGLEGFEPGTAYTLVTSKESQFAAQLVHNMDVSGQSVAPDLISLAKHDPRFRRGTPAKRSVVNGAPSASGSAPSAREEANYRQQQHQSAVASEQVEDDEDAQEMERWSESRRKSKTDQRKGLGFFDAPGASSGRSFGAGTGRNFVKASPAASLSSSFRSAFVKSTTAAPPAPASVPWGQHKAPPQAPPPPPLPQAFQPVPSPAVQVSQSFPPPLPRAYQPILSLATQVPPPPQAYQSVPVFSPSVQVPPSLPPPPPQLSAVAKATDAPVSVGNVAIQQVTGTPPRPTASTASSSKTWPQDTARQEPGTKVVSTNGGASDKPKSAKRDDSRRSRSRVSQSRSSSRSSGSPRARSSSYRRRNRSPSRTRGRYSRSRSPSRSRSRSNDRRRRRRSTSRSRSRDRRSSSSKKARYSRSRSRSYDRRDRRY